MAFSRRPRQIFLLLIHVLLAPYPALAQKQNNIWYFGENAGIDFRTTPPTVLNDGQVNTKEGSAGICDPATGALLFYTDGQTIWDRTHQPMQSGTGLYGHWSSTQSALILPDPADPEQYYVFTTDQSGYMPQPMRGFNYSKVDMRLNGGLGAVTQKNVHLLDSATEKLTAVAICGGISYWIIVHEQDTNVFLAYRLDENGLDPAPVRSTIGTIHGPDPVAGVGFLVASPNGQMLGSVCNVSGSQPSAELFKFNIETGEITDAIPLGGIGGPYGICFSPDNSRVYISGVGKLEQLTVTDWTANAIIGSRIRVANSTPNPAMQLGPDGKIYLSNGDHLGVIERPNELLLNAGFVPMSIPLAPGSSETSLPNILHGNAAPERFSVSLSALELLAPTSCDSASGSLDIENGSCGILDIVEILLEQPAGDTKFTIDGAEIPLIVGSGQPHQLRIAYDPNGIGEDTTALNIRTSAGTLIRIPIRGYAPERQQSGVIMDATDLAQVTKSGETGNLEFRVTNRVVAGLGLEDVVLELEYDHDVISPTLPEASPGWTLVQHDGSSFGSTLHLRRTGTGDILEGEPLARMSFKSFFAPQRNTTVAMTSLVFNPQDTNFERCILSSTFSGASSVDISEVCDDDAIRRSLSSHSVNGVLLRPNPLSLGASSVEIVAHAAKAETLTIDISDLNGRSIGSRQVAIGEGTNTFSLYFTPPAAGVYSVKLTTADQVLNRRLVVE